MTQQYLSDTKTLSKRHETIRLRAERMERVVAAAEDVVSYQGTQNEARYFDTLVNVLTEYRLSERGDV